MIHQHTFQVNTTGRGMIDITASVGDIVTAANIDIGLCNVFIHHTSASIVISENADPTVQHDLEYFMSKLIKDGDSAYKHDDEGPDDMPSHIRSVLTATTLSIPVKSGRMALGTWQGVYLWEHRFANHHRNITVTVLG